MKQYICKECGTKYSSLHSEPPPAINWSDGHVCEIEEYVSIRTLDQKIDDHAMFKRIINVSKTYKEEDVNKAYEEGFSDGRMFVENLLK